MKISSIGLPLTQSGRGRDYLTWCINKGYIWIWLPLLCLIAYWCSGTNPDSGHLRIDFDYTSVWLESFATICNRSWPDDPRFLECNYQQCIHILSTSGIFMTKGLYLWFCCMYFRHHLHFAGLGLGLLKPRSWNSPLSKILMLQKRCQRNTTSSTHSRQNIPMVSYHIVAAVTDKRHVMYLIIVCPCHLHIVSYCP